MGSEISTRTAFITAHPATYMIMHCVCKVPARLPNSFHGMIFIKRMRHNFKLITGVDIRPCYRSFAFTLRYNPKRLTEIPRGEGFI